MQRNHFLLLKKFKNTQNAQLWHSAPQPQTFLHCWVMQKSQASIVLPVTLKKVENTWDLEEARNMMARKVEKPPFNTAGPMSVRAARTYDDGVSTFVWGKIGALKFNCDFWNYFDATRRAKVLSSFCLHAWQAIRLSRAERLMAASWPAHSRRCKITQGYMNIENFEPMSYQRGMFIVWETLQDNSLSYL